MLPLKFPLDTIIRSKNIADTPISAFCKHIMCFDLVQRSSSAFPQMFISIFSALVVPATEVEVLVIVMVVVVEVAVEAAVVVAEVARKYCLFGQLIISLIISWKFQINIRSHS